jgi:hypothetical protein
MIDIDGNTALTLSGLVVNLIVVFSFFSKSVSVFTRLEHRLTKTETNVGHIMRKCRIGAECEESK